MVLVQAVLAAETYEFVTKWGTHGSGNEQFDGPASVAVDSSGNVYVADTGNYRIQKFSTDGIFLAKWGTEGSGDGQFDYPYGVAVDSSGNVYVADMNNDRIQKFGSTGTYLMQWGTSGSGDGQFNQTLGVAVDSSGNVYVADGNNHRIQKFSSTGTYLMQWGTSGSGDGQFGYYIRIAVDSSDNVYVADNNYNTMGQSLYRIQKFSSTGSFLAKWGTLGFGDGQFFGDLNDVAVDLAGNVYVTESSKNQIQKFSSTGIFLTKWGYGGSGEGQFWNPSGVTVDLSGNVYVADGNNNRIQKFATSAIPPVANFVGTPPSGAAPLTVTFTDSSTNTPTLWNWNFGDGITSASQNRSHVYTYTGTYTVALTASNAAGSNVFTRTNFIMVTSPITASTVGIFRSGNFYLASSNTPGGGTVTAFNFGMTGDVPVAGDWNGDGKTEVGIYRHGNFYLAGANTPGGGTVTAFNFGMTGDVPIAGDWDGSGTTRVGIFRSGNFYLASSNTPGGGTVTSFNFGQAGDVPVAGDWNGDGKTEVGIYRNGNFYLASSNVPGGGTVNAFNFGMTGDVPVIGNWNADDKDTVGVFRQGMFYLRNTNTAGNTDLAFTYGTSGDIPVTGKWFAPTVSSIFPTCGLKGATVGVTITGTNFERGATAKLTRAGYPTITATSLPVSSATSIDCYFNLASDFGSYNVVVTNPGGQSTTKTGAFSIVDQQTSNIQMIGFIYGLAAVPANGIDEIEFTMGLASGSPTMDLKPMKIVFSTPTTTTKILSQGTTASYDFFTTKDATTGSAVTTLSPQQYVQINFMVEPVKTRVDMNFEIRPAVGAALPFIRSTPGTLITRNVLY